MEQGCSLLYTSIEIVIFNILCICPCACCVLNELCLWADILSNSGMSQPAGAIGRVLSWPPFQRYPAGRMHPDADAQGRGTSLMTHSAVNYQNGGKR